MIKRLFQDTYNASIIWLKELINFVILGSRELDISKRIYQIAYNRFDEVCAPYKTVIDINVKQLPSPEEVNKWNGEKYASTLRHD
jgi:hypothetical protein